MTRAILAHVFPAAPPANLARLAEPLLAAMAEADIDTPLRQAHFLAQVGHESGDLAHLEENLDYRAATLRALWPKRFPDDATAASYAHLPQQIANLVYANRMGNGDEASGDGWLYRGGGLGMLTGKANYQLFGEAMGCDLVAHPERVRTEPELIVKTATWYWWRHALNEKADADDLSCITRAINGGVNGLADRSARLMRCKRILGVTNA